MEEKRDMLQAFAQKVQEILGSSIKKIILYGSYARGDFQINSDMDIMILTTLQNDEIRKIENRIYDIAFEYEMSDQVMISVNIVNEEQFNYWLGALPYYDNVVKEGIVLAG